MQVEQEHLQELATRVQWLEQQAIDKRQVHIVDREGDAVEWLANVLIKLLLTVQ